MFRSRRRIRLLLIFAAIGIAGLLVCRSWIAEIPNSLARRAMTQRTPEYAMSLLDWSEWIAGATSNTEFLRARASRKLGRWDEMKQHLARAEKLGGDKIRLQREDWLAKAQSGQLRLVQSRRNQMLLDPLDDTEEICEAFVLGYLSLQHFDEALPLIESWSADYPENPQPHYLKGLILAEERKFAQADASFRKALQIRPSHFQARFALANSLLSERKEKEALEKFQECAQRHTDATVELGIAKCLLGLGELMKAKASLESSVTKYPNDFKLRLELGRLLINDDFQAALSHLEQAHKIHSNSSEAQYLLAQALIRLGRREEAAEYLTFVSEANEQMTEMNKLLERVAGNETDVESRLQIAFIQLKYGTEREAILWFQSVLNIDPKNAAANEALANFYEKKSAENPHYADLSAYFRKATESGASR